MDADQYFWELSHNVGGVEIPDITCEEYARDSRYICGVCNEVAQSEEMSDLHKFDNILLNADTSNVVFAQPNGIWWVYCTGCQRFLHLDCIRPEILPQVMIAKLPWTCCWRKVVSDG